MEAIVNKLGGEEGAKSFLRGTVEIVVKRILDMIGIVKTSATSEKFEAKKKFVVNTKGDASVKISYLGDNFLSWFLAGEGKVEDAIPEGELSYGKLTKGSVDGPIIQELGGEAKAETTLTEMFDLMSKQSNAQEKEDGLLTNGWANIFYVRDTAGVLRAVDVGWDDGGWYVYARSVESPHGWHGGCQVFSRNS